ncbi:MAG: hypothetical protein HYV07_24850 [Deltaproteobacteria bacterium]|nr:hypothetical protein [Deltaproteobacteria bacterium]
MNDETKRPGLLRALSSGREAGARLRAHANPTTFVSDATRRTVLEELEESSRRIHDGAPLWARERAAIAVRAALATLADDDALRRAKELSFRLEAIDDRELSDRRHRLSIGTYLPNELLADLDRLNPAEIDPFVLRLLSLDKVPARETERSAGMVHYLPSPFSSILELASRVGPDDLLVDVGSGLGLIPVLVAWISGARTRGIELEPAYHRGALALASRVPVSRVELVEADCRRVSYADATFVYVYDTIRERLLDELLEKIELDTRGRAVRLASRGMSTPTFDASSWLEKVEVTVTGTSLYQRA